MSKGLGVRQRELLAILRKADAAKLPPLTYAELRVVLIASRGGNPARGDRLRESLDRALKRALAAMVNSKDVVIVGGKGGPKDPYRYRAIEDFAAPLAEDAGGVRDVRHAKKLVADLIAALHGVDPSPPGR